jgi:hypothetical protein
MGRPPAGYDPDIACFLEEIYTVCNRFERLELDPLAVVRRYSAPGDMRWRASYATARIRLG